MRTIAYLIALGLAVTMLPMLTPSANAVGTCTELTNSVNSGPDCPYLFCYGTYWSYPNPYVGCYNCFDPFAWQCHWPVWP